jgi:DNA end-binding protein Ku
MTEDFDPSAYHDNYREALQEVVDAKIEGREVTQPEAAPSGEEPTSLADALKASLAAARAGSRQAGDGDGAKTSRAKAGPAKTGSKSDAAKDGAAKTGTKRTATKQPAKETASGSRTRRRAS